MRILSLALAVVLPALAHCEEAREWTSRAGQKFTAGIIASDAFRATFAISGRGKLVLPLTHLSEADVAFIGTWRSADPAPPLVDPEKLAPWPADATATDIEVRLKSEDASLPAFVYEGARFVVQSDVKLPVAVVRDLNATFEATRMALMALPLGLHSGGEREKYQVFLFSSPEQYGYAGGPAASGGFYDGLHDRMLILLPNLGIRAEGEKKVFEHQKNLFVVKHEVTHQLLRRWGGLLPMWFSEGFAEVIAATPYTRGRYTFAGMDTAIGNYVRKWRSPGDLKPLYVTPPGLLMAMSPALWQSRVTGQTAYETYNSAALFTYFLLRSDGAGDGKPIAGFLDALRRGVPVDQATADHIQRGRSDEKLAADFAVFLRRTGLKFEFESSLPTR